MDKIEFKLDDEDFNRIAEISSNKESIMQIVSGEAIKLTNQQRVDRFWHSVSKKYGFNPKEPVVTNTNIKSPVYFMAEPMT